MDFKAMLQAEIDRKKRKLEKNTDLLVNQLIDIYISVVNKNTSWQLFTGIKHNSQEYNYELQKHNLLWVFLSELFFCFVQTTFNFVTPIPDSQIIWVSLLSLSFKFYGIYWTFSPRFLCRSTTFYILLLSVNVRELAISKTADFPAHLSCGTFSTFCGYRILFSIQNPNINRFTNHFSIHS